MCFRDRRVVYRPRSCGSPKCRSARRRVRVRRLSGPLLSETAGEGSINPHGSMTTARSAERAPFSRYCGHDSPKSPAPQPCVRTLPKRAKPFQIGGSSGSSQSRPQIRYAGEDPPIPDLAVYSPYIHARTVGSRRAKLGQQFVRCKVPASRPAVETLPGQISLGFHSDHSTRPRQSKSASGT